MSDLSPPETSRELENRLDALGAKVARGGDGAVIVVHAQDPGPGAERIAEAAPRTRILRHDSYDGLDDILAEARPETCLSYRFGTGYQRGPLVDGPFRPAYVHVAGTGFDHLVIAIRLTEDTRNLVSSGLLGALQRGADVVNLARGRIVDERALLTLLRSGDLRGAVFDVFETKPLPAGNPLWDAPGMIVTPHASALFEGWEGAAADIFCDNLRRIGADESPVNRIDPLRGY